MIKKLGVVVPAYNCEEYISQCVESILRQTYSDIEVAIVNDGSTDNTWSIIKKYEERNSNVTAISQENAGPIKARYAGIKALKDCEYITFVDSDDWIDERMYENLMSFILKYNPDLVLSGIYRYHDDDYIREGHDLIEEGYINLRKEEKSVIDFFGNRTGGTSVDASLCTKIFIKEKIMDIYEKAWDLNIHYGEDIAITFPYIMLCESVYCTHKAYYYHRIKKEIASYAKGEDYFEKLLRLYDHLLKCFKEDKIHFPKLLEELDYCFIQGVEFRKMLYETESRSNNRYLFPFGKVNKGEDIIIYGMGHVGKGYVRQIKDTNYCNVAAAVDRYSKEAGFHSLADIKKLKFDHIIIAIAGEKMRKQILKDMMYVYGIPKEKIIDEVLYIG